MMVCEINDITCVTTGVTNNSKVFSLCVCVCECMGGGGVPRRVVVIIIIR